MSQIKSRQIYTQTLDEPDKKSADELTAAQTFQTQNSFVPDKLPEDSRSYPEEKLTEIIRPDGKRKWRTGGIVTAFAGLIGWQTVDTVMSAVQNGDWLSIGWSAFIASLAGLGLTAIGRELWKLRKLRRHFSVQEQGEQLQGSDSIGRGRGFCQKLAKQSHLAEEHPAFERWQNSIHGAHSDSDILAMYDGMVLSLQDKQARKLIARFASEAAVLVAVSPLATADMLLVAWRNFKLIDRLADIYGVELGYWSRIRLFRLVLLNMAAAGVSEVVTDTGMDLLSVDLAGKVSARVAQGFGVGLLTARLGIRAVSLLRPIPWHNDNRMRLSEIRKQLILSLKQSI
ncbi:TIGR01620 family protein [Vibrio sp. HA2012]|uniref:YcjF family protein n=1 Tax=Vibrio sp. HA2012 TaxID=1971595 RepID=UPI000C2C7454|nr:TIGR01620 family protein [Vibrio sp. HA2012]PJC88008.1 TIGR01620 family protein [Vibrio sp. HA2012]